MIKLKRDIQWFICVITALVLSAGPSNTNAQVHTSSGIKPPEQKKVVEPEEPDCKTSNSFNKNICNDLENNSAILIKNQLQRKSNQNSSAKIKEWVQQNYPCIVCKEEPGFSGGTMLRKVVYENSLSVAFMMVYEMQVDMNLVEKQDGRTLLDWLQDETEKVFDEMFETENEEDKKWLMESMNNKLKFYNLFKNNGAMFTHELIAARGKALREQEEGGSK